MVRLWTVTAVAGMLLAGTASLSAQDAEEPAIPVPGDVENFRHEIDDLKSQLTTLKQRVDTQQSDLQTVAGRVMDHQGALDALRSDVRGYDDEIARIAGSVRANQDDIERIARSVEVNRENIAANTQAFARNSEAVGRLQSSVTDNNRKLRDISRYDSGSDRYVPRLLGNMRLSRSFAQEVHNSTTGRIRIYNPTGVEQDVFINGVHWRARPDWSYAPVPRGPVAVQRSLSEPRVVLNTWRFVPGRGLSLHYNVGTHSEMYQGENATPSPPGGIGDLVLR